MTQSDKEKLRAWVQNWKKLGPILEELRREELKTLNIAEEILSLSDASEVALRMYPPKPSSGLVEMQRLFMKLKK